MSATDPTEGWAKLSDAYARRGISLIIGAGVSAACGIPTWRGLLGRIATRCLGPDGTDLAERLMDLGYSLPAVASILEAKCPLGLPFVELVRQELYATFPFYPAGIDNRNRRAFIRFVRENNPTLRTVASFCAARDARTDGFVPNPRIRSVVNLNLDAVLRSYCYHRYRKSLLRTVERASSGVRSNRLNVYHMHGFLQFSAQHIGNHRQEADSTVLTEQEYFNFFNQPTSMYSYTFLFTLRESTCVFVGLSLRDDNIRRMLHYSRSELFASNLKEQRALPDALDRSKRHFAIQSRTDNPAIDALNEVSLDRLGVTTLWIDDYADITTRFAALYESSGARWKDVF